ncbi:hypothetical protein AB239_03645 [Salmonella enterica]|nr:hypothetical protein [Salmonella enterica]EBV5751976.1 hypothetical protein [Salmonella enterica subsp. enterica serovar Inverness]EAQ5988816.1 hypothetical protein [Salmonella enterica]EAU0133869.1 hypothetical protein [Salmonella enterica]EAX0769945.1 hypothetical protein [Salmonella enterica]
MLIDEAICCLPGMFEDEEKFHTRFKNIEKVPFSAAMNKQITLWLKEGKKTENHADSIQRRCEKSLQDD